MTIPSAVPQGNASADAPEQEPAQPPAEAHQDEDAAAGAGTAAADAGFIGADADVSTAGPDFVTALANVLTHLAGLAGRAPPANRPVTRFHAVRAPLLSIHEYIQRIATYFRCSDECFVLALVYIDRIMKLHPEFTICNLNIHRLLVTSVMLSAKFFDDVYYSNAYYARVGGVRTLELNALEVLFLRLIKWRLHVLPMEYELYRRHVLTAVHGGGEQPAELPGAGPDAGLGENVAANADQRQRLSPSPTTTYTGTGDAVERGNAPMDMTEPRLDVEMTPADNLVAVDNFVRQQAQGAARPSAPGIGGGYGGGASSERPPQARGLPVAAATA